jgi:hypothetical protein
MRHPISRTLIAGHDPDDTGGDFEWAAQAV